MIPELPLSICLNYREVISSYVAFADGHPYCSNRNNQHTNTTSISKRIYGTYMFYKKKKNSNMVIHPHRKVTSVHVFKFQI